MSLICGVDEAGRGALIGPLVIGLAIMEESKLELLEKLNVKDSKLLSPSTRTKLAVKIRELCECHTIKITAKELNTLMKSYTLNEIEAMTVGKKLNELDVTTIIVDSPDPNPKKFEKRIRTYYKRMGKIISENKADYNYKIVSAASIIAKVERDSEIREIQKELGYDFNSGYTSDQVTIDYVKKNLDNPALKKYLRTAWKTLSNIKQRKLDDF